MQECKTQGRKEGEIMRIKRVISVVIMVTIGAVLYVKQEIDIVNLGYEVGGAEKELARVVDINRILSYNLEVMKTPQRLERALEGMDVKLQIPGRSQIVYTAEPVPPERAAQESVALRQKRSLVDFLLGRAEARVTRR
jgi:hypothetical protein